jgi:hypothetical protein
MPYRIQLNDNPVKHCKSCGVFHPFTREYWYILDAAKQLGQCKIRHTKYDKSAQGKSSHKKSQQKCWDRAMVNNSKSTDQLTKRYEEGGFITREYIKNSMKLQNTKCYYCKDPMLYGVGINRNKPNAATVERIYNTLGHFCENCVLCHKRCQYRNLPPRTKNLKHL